MARNKAFDIDHKLTVARDLFWEKGYHATSINDLVDTLGLNRSSIYDTYGSKHELFLSSLTNYAQLKISEYQTAGKGADSAFSALTNIIRSVVEHTLKDDRNCLIVKSTFEVAGKNDDIRAIIVKHGKVLQEIFASLIRKAQQNGEIGTSKDPEVMAAFILSSFSGFWQQYILSGSREQVDKSVEFLISVIK
ncbi:hypothetical protein TH53_06220 [Pedobacter lusitanus]|uniref:HTH tetR-type domain-containing protein n=1 Tax=Pedobacter lusitanus TaxID=1503925 RepID=A0A0D0GUA5_9SPHI|nr:TetR/AcrR family transcriptional regulator [Pedobacter lusitanus]KIO78021.1 hypothetical protein TH53_06220 [Pedobacter lusitanus]